MTGILKNFLQRIPLGRTRRPEDLVGALIYSLTRIRLYDREMSLRRGVHSG